MTQSTISYGQIPRISEIEWTGSFKSGGGNYCFGFANLGSASSSSPGLRSQKTFEEIYGLYRSYQKKGLLQNLDKSAVNEVKNKDGLSLFSFLIKEGEFKSIETLLSRNKVVVNAGHLYLAARYGFRDIVEILLEWITFDVANDRGYTPLHTAIQYGQHEVVPVLKLKNFFCPIVGFHDLKLEPIEYAVVLGEMDCFRELSKEGSSLTSYHGGGEGSLLHLAIRFGKQQMAELLVKKDKMLLKNTNARGETPLIYAASEGNFSILEFLLRSGAEMEFKGNNRRTALDWAVVERHRSVVEVLVQYGADVSNALQLLKGAQDFAGKSLYNFLSNIKNLGSSRPRVCHPKNVVFGGGNPKKILKELKQSELLDDVIRVASSLKSVLWAALFSLGEIEWKMPKENVVDWFEKIVEKVTKVKRCTLQQLRKRSFDFSYLKELRVFTPDGKKEPGDSVISELVRKSVSSKVKDFYPIDAFDEHRYVHIGSKSREPIYNLETLGIFPESVVRDNRTMTTLPEKDRVFKKLINSSRSRNTSPFGSLRNSRVWKRINFCRPPVDLFFGRKVELEKLKKVFLESSNQHLRVQVVYGIRGVGKHELARAFVKKNQDKFSLAILIENDFRLLSRHLRLRTEGLSPHAIKRRVYETLERDDGDKPWLLIFNRSRTDLPRGRGCVLVLSEEEPTFYSSIHLKLFERKEAIQFFKKELGEKEKLSELLDTVGYLPQTLFEVISYIKKMECTVKECIEKFKKCTGKSRETWMHTRKRLKAPSREWLDLCLHFESHKISERWLTIWSKNHLDILQDLRGHNFIQGRSPTLLPFIHNFLPPDKESYAKALALIERLGRNLKKGESSYWLTHAKHIMKSKFRSSADAYILGSIYYRMAVATKSKDSIYRAEYCNSAYLVLKKCNTGNTALLLNDISTLFRRLGSYKSSMECIIKAQIISRDLSPERRSLLRNKCIMNLGATLSFLVKQSEKAYELLNESLVYFTKEASKDKDGYKNYIRCLKEVGLHHENNGRLDLAKGFYEEAYKNQMNSFTTLYRLGVVCFHQGTLSDEKSKQAYYKESIKWFKVIDTFGLKRLEDTQRINMHIYWGLALHYIGESKQGKLKVQKAHEEARRIKDNLLIAKCCYKLGCIFKSNGDDAKAFKSWDAAHKICPKKGKMKAILLLKLGELARKLGKLEESYHHLNTYMTYYAPDYAQLDKPFALARAEYQLGVTCARYNKPEEAKRYLTIAHIRYRKLCGDEHQTTQCVKQCLERLEQAMAQDTSCVIS